MSKVLVTITDVGGQEVLAQFLIDGDRGSPLDLADFIQMTLYFDEEFGIEDIHNA